MDQTLLKIIRLYKASFNIKLFLLLRNLHLSYSRIESLVPRKGLIIDLGCGYGFFPNLLAYLSQERKIVGVELSKRKIKYADIGFTNTEFVNEDIQQVRLSIQFNSIQGDGHGLGVARWIPKEEKWAS